jgi:hypothetical protein
MGHDFIKYEGSCEQFNDFHIWVLRHFFVKESLALETAKRSTDITELRKFFEAWDWVGTGVVTNTDFSSYIFGSRARWRLALDLLQWAGDRIAEFGEQIPLPYLEAHINRRDKVTCTAPLPTKPLLIGVGRICRLLASHEPSETSLRAMQVLGAIGIEAYLSRNGIADPDLESYIWHLWEITSTTRLPVWDGECTRLCDRLVARLASEKAEHLRHLCNAACEITASQMYTVYKPDKAAAHLRDVSRLSGLDLESLAASELFCRHAPGPDGWGEPVPQNLVHEWKELAQQIAAGNSHRAGPSSSS